MERATKLIVFLWACAALAFVVHLVARGWGELQMIALAVFAASAALTAYSRKAIALVLAVAYLFPVLIRTVHGDYFILYGVLWMAALLGALAPDGLRTAWHIPNRFRGALVCWALVVAVGTPIVVWRELDFNAGLLDWPGPVWSSIAGGLSPSNAAPWIAYVGLVPVLGILWFDWLLMATDDEFRWWVTTPLLASAGAMAAVSAYQMFGNVLFLNETLFGALGRASGTLFDANLCGAIAALWIAGAALWADDDGVGQRWRLWVAGPVAALAGVAVWASGSRSAFAAAVLVGLFGLAGLCVARRRAGAGVAKPLLAAAAVFGVLLVLAVSTTPATGPLERFSRMVPDRSMGSLRAAVVELWNRNEYGVISTAMIRKFPSFGVGIGSFQTIAPDFASTPLPPDNAQNWYRHQLVELGVVGSLGWAAWVAAMAGCLLTSRKVLPRPFAIWTARGALVAFAAISFFGVPGQDVTAVITLWMMVVWFLRTAAQAGNPSPLGKWAWLAIVAVVVAYAGGAASLAAADLRVPARALARGWHYSYGFYDPEPDGAGGEFRWAAQRAARLIDVPGDTRWLHLRINTNHFDIAEKPVDVKVWSDGRLVLESRLDSTLPVTQYVQINRAVTRTLLETWTSRVVRPSSLGIADDRQLGIMVAWTFADGPPPGAPAGRP